MKKIIVLLCLSIFSISFFSCNREVKKEELKKENDVELSELRKFTFYYHNNDGVRTENEIYSSYRMDELIKKYHRRFSYDFNNLDSVIISRLDIDAWCHILPSPHDENWEWIKEDYTLRWDWVEIRTLAPCR
jgi:hypothetical protein